MGYKRKNPRDMKIAKPGSIKNLVLHLRCEWCKQLFDWHPFSSWNIEHALPRTCSSGHASRLASWLRERRTA